MTYTRQELVNDAKEQLLAFINSGRTNAWVHTLVGEFYLRNQAVHRLSLDHDDAKVTFDVANVTLFPQYRGVAIMHELLEWINTAHNCDYTYIQSIQNAGFAASLIEHNWIKAHGSEDDAPHVYRARSNFDPTQFSFEVVEDTNAAGNMRFSCRALEVPQFQVYEHTEAAVRREMFRFLEHLEIENVSR